MDKIKKVYLAGKISMNGWRHSIVDGLRNLYQGAYMYQDANELLPMFPVSTNVIDGYFDYTGPYFISDDHGCLHREEHGIGSGVCGGGGASDFSKHYIVGRCLHGIYLADIVIAYINSMDAYGTLVELGFAKALGKRIQIFSSNQYMDENIYISHDSDHVGNDLWFAFQLSWDDVIYIDDNDDREPAKSIINYLQKFKWIDYHEYIQSDEWKEKATAAKERAGWRCQTCNKNGDKSKLHAHHRTYERLGKELPEDITVLCAKCHAKFHDKD